jgi:hypothetical protein
MMWVYISCLFSISPEPISNTRMFLYFVYCILFTMRRIFFIDQYVQPCLSKNPKYTFYTIKSSLTLAYKGRLVKISEILKLLRFRKEQPQALVSFKKYMPPPLTYFKVDIYPFPLPHFASRFFAYFWSFRWPNYIVSLPRYFSFWLPHLNIPYSHFRFALDFLYAFGILYTGHV